MNISKLHSVVEDLINELQRCAIVPTLKQLVTSYSTLVSHPQHTPTQKTISELLSNLYYKLETSPVDEYPQSWREAVEELNISAEFGKALKANIENIFSDAKSSSKKTLENISELYNDLTETAENLDQLKYSLNFFGISKEDLKEEECELGVMFPREYVNNNLKAFGKELVELEKTLMVFSELAIGSRNPLQIRKIASTDLAVFLEYIPAVGACIAVAVERMVALYRQILEIKKLKMELEKKGIPTKEMKNIDDHAESLISPAIDEVTSELIKKYGGHLDKNRKTEVTTELRHSLKKLASKIDNGVSIELRISPPLETEENDKLTSEDIAIQQIIDSSKRIEFSEFNDKPILHLSDDNDVSGSNS